MLGDVGQPQPVRACRGEVPLDEVVVHGRARLLPPATSAGVGGDDLCLGADLPYPPLRDLVPGRGELVGDEPVPEPRVVTVDLERGVHRVGVDQVPLADRVGAPGIERLGRELQHPAGHRHGDPVDGKVTDQRVGHFGL